MHELVNELLLSPMGRRDWPLRFYSRELLFSVEARRRFAPPDLGGPALSGRKLALGLDSQAIAVDAGDPDPLADRGRAAARAPFAVADPDAAADGRRPAATTVTILPTSRRAGR